jgi:hypothetical protein
MSNIISRTSNTITKRLFCDLIVVTVYCWNQQVRTFTDHFFNTEAEAAAFVDGLSL